MASIILDASIVKSKKSGKNGKKNSNSILDDLEEIDGYTPPSLLSQYKPEKKKKTDVDELAEASNESAEDWLESIETFRQTPIKASKSKGSSGIFDYLDGDGKKKKKKNKKKDNGATDYSKEFEPEMMIIRNILEKQTGFTNSLQKKFDTLEGSKSAARGIGKFTNDLIAQINQARDMELKATNALISVKKTIADLKMKDAKDRIDATGEDMGAYSASFLKKVLSQSRTDLAAYGGDTVPVEGDVDDIFEGLDDVLDERPDEVELYMKYGTDVTIRAVVDKETKEYEFEAVNSNGDIIPDYPLPHVDRLDINMSTEMASDEYYNKYPIRWE